MHVLSKTTYMRGRQCPKALFLYKHRRDLLPPVDAQRQAIFDAGTHVGLLAQQLFPGGLNLQPESPYDFGPSVAATQDAIRRGERVLYEAAFVFDDVLAALDILVRTDEGWKAYEVKSSGSVKPYHVHDAALQAHVIEGTGLQLADVSIIHINTTYARSGELDIEQLFTVTSIRDKVAAERVTVSGRITALKAMLTAGQEPAVDIGPHCDKPFSCDFRAHCWAHMPCEHAVTDLTRARGKDWSLYARGIRRLEEIPEDEPLTLAQRVQVNGWKHGQTVIDREALRAWLDGLRYPLYHFDFETFAAAVPPYDASRPHQPIPFQYSLHVQRSPGGDAVPHAFLGDGRGDPREALTQQLLRDLGEHGDILVFHASFERARLQELARDLPHHASALETLLPRLKDLEVPFLSGWYYAPAMNGSTSIKKVLPALVPALSYKALVVQEGTMASFLYGQFVAGRYAGDVAQLRTDLLAYCGMDTEAMVEILSVLQQSC